MADEAPRIQIDSDWKAQAQAEKQRLADQAKARQQQAGQGGAADTGPSAGPGGAARSAGPQGMPPPTFETLVSTMVTQALFAMGAIPDPRSGQRMQNLDLARHHIDMLSVLEEKTKGNLNEEETNLISGALYELRSRYVQAVTAARNV